MRYYRVSDQSGSFRLVVDTGESRYDVTAVKPSLTSFEDLVRSCDITGTSIDAVVTNLLDDAPTVDADTLSSNQLTPIEAEEVWAAGVTYEMSEQARENESGMPDVYLNVYEGDRPELFFKATPSRTVGSGDRIGVRGDSDWNVPEPELGIVLYRGDIVGYTIGNDVSSREIEGENPLYLPQAKVYDRCCAIGPCVVPAEAIDDPHDLELTMTITRDGETMYDESTSTAEMVRTCEELVSFFDRHNTVPETAVLLTGTPLVPDDSFTLREDDHVAISIEDIGTLENRTITV
ncbi:fumarylacetoacetate hydrolase [Natronorubrum sp. JWXQ-INN-674]|uniref:Fumarylacetoacetate hydrolase n=1 Tax=Natronorubrum halalkaliphilum TaxID=2691917 RepID=A0A6B0VGB4_9EURY|nr:fumarylacetoacetate hydrolase family protein [Natronorubrum halalkaliphilum]MXV60548.1 fumarylacetoacetate hydrolase [Natronorubrum halalkaliphilum]